MKLATFPPAAVISISLLACAGSTPNPAAEEDADIGSGRGGAGGASTGGRGGGGAGFGGTGGVVGAGGSPLDARPADGPVSDLRPADAPPVTSVPPGSVAVLTNRYDNLRTGATTKETILNTTNVTPTSFGLLFSRQYDGNPYGQPLYVPGVTAQGKKRNLVFLATTTNHLYAFDGDDPAAMMPVWSKQLAPPADIQVSKTKGVTGLVWCGDMHPFTGITSTPVIDPTTGRVYVVSKTGKVGGAYTNKLHVLDIATGTELPGSPVVIEATVPGTGAGNKNGMVSFDGWKHMARPGLLLHQGAVYVAFGSHCDVNPYHGWVFAYDAATLARKYVFNTTANGEMGGIWQSGVGLAANDRGVFFAVGNGSYAADGSAVGTSVVRLNHDLTLGDFFTPSDAKRLNDIDQDIAGGVMLLPETNNLLAAGKQGAIYVIDQMNMTKHNPMLDQIVQRMIPPGGGEIHNLTYWNGHVYVWPDNNGLRMHKVTGGKLDIMPVGRYDGLKPKHPGGIVTISANGTMAGTGIVWAAVPTAGNAWHEIATGALVALDASAPEKKLWDSSMNPRDNVGHHAKFSPPTVANGKVYVASFAPLAATSPAYLRVYGILPGAAP